eukprot:CAMPEP_0116138224 /NCGR_PEP_ID=MMETSP0329-20121206/12673_1 /TAXON_ID=697910 /ORGANISM="Pseudo-nitzschia arenysensis, Strain B593" /LENGTH=613 /DNA_ID=CAMNT_0003633203 /DNA_START=285 /DNA_END=2126 /DNA_ORIENTATION=-
MATSSSDLKNDIEQTKNLATIDNESPTKKQKATDKTLEELGGKREKKFEGISNNVVSRLARAAKEAAVAKKKKEITSAANDNKKTRMGMDVSYIGRSGDASSFTENMFEDDEHTSENQSDLSSITKLNSVIDQELLRPNDGYKPARETDSIRVLLEHNNNQKQDNGRPAFNKSIISPSSASSSKLHNKGKNSDTNLTQKDVAIVFGRPLGEDQITIEYAIRLVSLAKAMKFEGYKPNLICFCGPASTPTNSHTTNTTTTKNRSVTSIGVEFFQKLCADNGISLEGTDLCRVPSLSLTRSNSHKESHDDGYSNKHASSFSFSSSWSIFSLSPVAKKLLGKHYLEKWLEESEAYESDMDEYGMTRQEPRKKIHIHWKLFSTEYHLCNLNDIHIRSPRQSPLARLTHDLEHAASSEDYRRGIIQTTWSFHYSIYPYVVSSNKQKMKEAFLGKCYLMAQSLVPLLVNLKGVAENSEFFQRDNYRTLVATRRVLATLLEQMNEAYRNNRERQISTMVIPPTLKAQLKKQTSGSSTTISSIEIHLECALLSLGRCCDLVRPAGTFSEQSVSRQEWKDALLHLQEFMNRIECSCDPDRPVPADKWDGKLTENRPVMEFLL